ncbi:Uncharacterised protein [Mycobacteroides abscessus subsp. abscessus]|nr:Uncharacterised protein [Mycobacteroides abscessus subsp. abscessus]
MLSESCPSRCSVGSSKSNTGTWDSSARASSIRRRCPPDTDPAPAVIIVSSPCGNDSSQGFRPTTDNASIRSPSGASPRATRRLSRTVVANRCASSAKNRISPGSSAAGKSASASLWIRMVPETGRVSPARVVSNDVLPMPLAPVTAILAPAGSRKDSGPDMELPVCQRSSLHSRAASAAGLGITSAGSVT